MLADPPVAEMLEIASSEAPLLERAQGLVQSVDAWLAADAVWLTLSDPGSRTYATVGSAGLERSVLDYLDRPSVARGIRHAGLNRNRPPISVRELPVPVEELPTWADCLIPAGFHDGLGVPLTEPGGTYVGLLSVLFSSREPPTQETRASLGELGPLIARGVSPMRSLLASTRIVQGATAGAVLLRNGTTHPLPGLDDHPLVADDSVVVRLARKTLLAGQEYRSFMWPTHDSADCSSHARMTVLAATDVPAFVLGTLILTPDPDCRGLTPRELEVLGLVVDGRSNQQIARRLAISARTVAAHMEHILHKLEVPTRTLAAVLAEREGCHVPPAPQRRR